MKNLHFRKLFLILFLIFCALLIIALIKYFFIDSSDISDSEYLENLRSKTKEAQEEVVDVLNPQSFTIVAAGDISCPSNFYFPNSCKQYETAELVKAIDPHSVLVLGDLQYQNGTLKEFQESYEKSWGQFKSITRPTPGNHEYHTPKAQGYYQYFGDLAGDPEKGYYSFNIGSWHVVVLNSNCELVGGCQEGAPQEKWLREDLKNNPAACTLAYWHHPRFSSGVVHGDNSKMQPVWNVLIESKADVVLAGHEHHYERFAPMDVNGTLDQGNGIRQFIVGTGGRSLYAFNSKPHPSSEKRESGTYGVLKLVLEADSYQWEFVPVPGKEFTDSGKSGCIL